MSLVQSAHNKDAVSFQKELHEKLEAKVNVALDEVKIEVAQKLLGEAPTGNDNSSEGGVSTMAAGGQVGKNRLPDTTDIKSSAGNPPPGGTKLAHISVRPGTKLAVDPKLPGQVGEAVEEKPAPHEQREGSKGKRALRMALKKKYDKRQRDESTERVAPALDEKVIQAGSIDHMAHAVHAAASGHLPHQSSRGTFTSFEHPHYHISRDHGSINPDKHEMNYHVQGAGGHHMFHVEHTKAGIDVKHVKKVS